MSKRGHGAFDDSVDSGGGRVLVKRDVGKRDDTVEAIIAGITAPASAPASFVDTAGTVASRDADDTSRRCETQSGYALSPDESWSHLEDHRAFIWRGATDE